MDEQTKEMKNFNAHQLEALDALITDYPGGYPEEWVVKDLDWRIIKLCNNIKRKPETLYEILGNE